MGKTMNFVNATHVNGESESNENMNYVSECWNVGHRSLFFTNCTHFAAQKVFLIEIFFCLFYHAEEAPVLLSPKLACRWKYR